MPKSAIMNRETQQRLLQLNRQFYTTVAEPFDQTRRSWPTGMARLLDYLPVAVDRPLRVLDAGCGNGRFACVLDGLQRPITYTGVDADAQLLALARAHTAGLNYTNTRFVQADLSEPGWIDRLAKDEESATLPRFDIVACLAALHHLPGYPLRAQVVAVFANLLEPSGLLLLSTWQFLTSERFAARQIDWQTIGLASTDVEAGDALLPWKQGHYAVRYVHQIDLAELERLANDAHLRIVSSYRADGKEGNLNLYAVLRPSDDESKTK
jgi:SAM-dependent methyltransferase